jgi:hypothetical protein
MLRHRRVDRRRHAHRRLQLLPYPIVGGEANQQAGELERVANSKVKPVSARSDLLCHPANVAADHGPPMGKSLLDN